MSGMSKKKWKIAALLALSCLVMSPVLAFDAGAHLPSLRFFCIKS